MGETFVQKQVRLVLEQQCRDIAEKLKAMCPAGVGFTLFLTDFGEKGNTSYVSTCDREDMIRLLEEHLERQGRIRTPVTSRVRAETLRDVADGLAATVDSLSERGVNVRGSLKNVIARLRRDADALEKKDG